MAGLNDNWLSQRARSCPDRLAVRADGIDLSYRALEAEAAATATSLAEVGVRSRSLVAIALPAGIDHVVCLHALSRLGAVALPLDPRFTEAERERALGVARPELVIGEPPRAVGSADAGAPAPMPGPRHAPEAPLCVLLTSGTTAVPRAVRLTHGNFLASATGSAFNLGVLPDDRWLCCLPLHHIAGLSILIRSVIYGTGAIVHSRFDPEAVQASLVNDGISLVSLVSTQLQRLLDIGADLSGPRALLVGGGPVPRPLLRQAEEAGATVVQTYGMTETCSQITTLAAADAPARIGSAGRPLLGSRIQISAQGEIMVSGPVVSPGAVGADNWLRTGDLGRIDDDGFLYVEGRRTDLIVTGGENVSPAEVEAALTAHPAVADAAVIGRPDPVWQETVTAVVVIREGEAADPEELRVHCAQQLVRHKVPKQIEFASELPRTASGKLLRRLLREPAKVASEAGAGDIVADSQ